MRATALDQYQRAAHETAVYPPEKAITYLVLGLNAEAGEIAEKWKRVIRDHGGRMPDELHVKMVDELGDLLWYLAELSTVLQVDLSYVASKNLTKLDGRRQRGTLHGEAGDR